MPPMKISGVDRCGCLIQSARLESSDLRHYNHHRRCRHHHHHLHQCRRYRRFQPPFRLAFKPLSQSDVTPSSGESNPFGQSTSSLFVPGSFSSLPFFSFLRRLFSLLSFCSFLSSLFRALLALMTVLLSRESLPRERFAIEGCSYRFPGAFRSFNPASLLAHTPSSVPAQQRLKRLIPNKLERGT